MEPHMQGYGEVPLGIECAYPPSFLPVIAPPDRQARSEAARVRREALAWERWLRELTSLAR